MKKIYRKIKPTIILSAFAFCLLNCGGHLQAAHQNQQKDPEYAPGQLVIKLKQGRSLDDIQDLNLKYNVRTPEKVFKDTPSPEETLNGMKEKLGKLDTSHESWYWQLDKNSQEYKDYAAKIEGEKEELRRQIEAQDKLIAKLEQRQKRAPADAQTPELDNIYLLNSDAKTNIPAMDAEYSANEAVEYAEPNYVVKAMAAPNDPYYSSSGSWGQSYDDLWGLKKIQAEKAWDISQGEGVVVAVVDSGIDYTHEDIADNIWKNSVETAGNGIDDDGNGYVDDVKGYDFANSDSDPLDDYGHGTHVAGTIAATGNNSKGVIGVAYKSKVMAIKGLEKSGKGYDSNLAQALQYAADNGADVINNSWAGQGSSKTIENAVNYAYTKGCVIIAAAANNNSDVSLYYPACFENVITIAASDHNDTRSDFSNYGLRIDVSAPGGDSESKSDSNATYRNILSLRAYETNMYKDDAEIIGTLYYRSRGTSMAAPHVSGVAALILSERGHFTSEEVRQVLRLSADDLGSKGFDVYYGSGRINAYNAVMIDTVCTVRINFPEAKNMLKTGAIEIKGMAKGDNLSYFKLEYSNGTLDSWTQIGSDKYSSINEGLLSNWEINISGIYYLRLTAVDKNNNSFQTIIGPLIIDKDLRQGWPQYLGNSPKQNTQRYYSPFTVADVDNDGKKEIIIEDDNQKIHILKENGEYLQGWPLTLNQGVISDIICIDSDDDGTLEIFFACLDHYIYGYHHDGTKVKGWPQYLNDSICDLYNILGLDMNNDEKTEILVYPATEHWNKVERNADLYIFNTDGSILQKWPIYKHTGNYSERTINNFGTGLSAGDINKDGFPEIIVPLINSNDSNYYLYVFNYKGEVLKSLRLNDIKDDIIMDYGRPILGDLDKDGDTEIICAKAYKNSQNQQPIKLFVFSYDNGQYTKTVETDVGEYGVPGQPSLADIDNNGTVDIIFFAGEHIKAFDYNGNLLFKSNDNEFAWANVNGSPAIGDITGDGKKEIIVGDITSSLTYKPFQKIHVLNNDGSKHSEYNTPASELIFNYTSVTITDIDNDGTDELIMFYPSIGTAIVWDTQKKYDTVNIDWPMFQHDIYRSGNYDFNPETADTTAPEGSILLASNSSGYTKTARITLSLSANDNVGVSGYYLSENSSTPSADASGWITVTSTTSYSADVSYTLSAGEGTNIVYCWYKDAAGNISEQYKASAILDTTTPVIAITSPTSSSAYSTSSSNLNLGGTASDATSGVKEITWKSNKGGSGVASGTTSWSVSNISLSKGKNIITVTAKDNVGNEKSTTLNVTYTAAATPSKPSNLSAYAISTQTVKLIWKDNSNNETGFRIERKAKNSQYNEISVVSANITLYNDSGLKTHTEYTYRVRAYNNTGSSSYSNIATTTTKKQRTIRK